MRHAFGTRRAKARTAAAVLILFLCVFSLSPLAVSRPTSAVRAETDGETSSETIQKALRDFQSEDPAIRKRAILILGKYPDERARSALVDALDDPHATVRRNALVSMTEQNWFPTRQLGSVLKLLGDDDVHIRRIASSALPNLRTVLRAALASDFPNANALARTLGIDDSALEAVKTAFVDSDETVRKNMLTYASLFPGLPGKEALARLLKDGSAEIRVKAVALAADTLSADALASACRPLVNDESAAVRRRLVDELARRTTPANLELLEALSRDDELSIAAAAAEALLRRGKTVSAEIVRNALQATSVDNNLKVRLLFAVRRQAAPGNPYDKLLRDAYTSPQPRIRAAALRARALVLDDKQRRKDALAMLEDPAEAVRTAALTMIKHSASQLAPAELKQLLRNPHADIRRQIVGLSRNLQPEEARELLLELLLDDNTAVRANAIAEFGRRRLPGAHRILRQSLRDDNKTITRAAVVGLINLADPKAADILQTYAEKENDQQLLRAARRLRQRLQ